VYGWGPKNGFVYQKAYLELLVPSNLIDELITRLVGGVVGQIIVLLNACDELINQVGGDQKLQVGLLVPKNGFVYQKAYLELLVPSNLIDELITRIEKNDDWIISRPAKIPHVRAFGLSRVLVLSSPFLLVAW
jgi:hypothetical protein